MSRPPFASSRTETAGCAIDEGLRGIDQLIAGDDGAPAQQHRVAIAILVQLAADRRATALLGVERVFVRAHQAEFQCRGRAEHALGLRRVLHARQLHHDAVEPLALHHRLGDAELVHPVAQRDGVLLDGEVASLGELALGHAGGDQRPGSDVRAVELDLGIGFAQQLLRFIGIGCIRQLDAHHIAIDAHAAANAGIAQNLAEVGGIAIQALIDRLVHVHLKQEMHATAQIEAQAHGLQTQRGEPGGRARRQRQRGDIAAARAPHGPCRWP